MKYSILFWVLALVLVGCGESKEDSNSEELIMKTSDLETYKLHGKVKSMKEVNYRTKEVAGYTTKDQQISNFEVNFNEEGDSENVTHFSQGETKVAETKINGSRKEGERTFVIIDPSGATSYSKVEKYDKYGRLIDFTALGADGQIESRYTESWNKEGLMIERKQLGPNDNLVQTSKFEYNDQNQIQIKKYFGRDGKLERKMEFYYNNDFVVRTVDENLIQMQTQIIEQSYEFDNQGNWTKRIIKVDGRPNYITERMITYY